MSMRGVPARNDQIVKIRAVWFRYWKSSIGYDSQPTNNRVPPINNSQLLLPNGDLKKALVLHGDYELIPKDAWILLKSWYGGGPDVPMPVEFDPFRKEAVPVVHLSTFHVTHGAQTKPVKISKFKPVLELKRAACKVFGLTVESTTLYELWNGVKDKSLDEKKIISELCLKDGQKFVLDIDGDDVKAEKLKKEKEEKKPKETEEPLKLTRTRSGSQTDLLGSEAGFCGLINIGETCYLNSILQCIMHIKPFSKYFTDGKWKDDLITTKGKAVVPNAFAALMNDVWTTTAISVSPKVLVDALAASGVPMFQVRRQHDVHESLTILMDLLHEGLNRANKKKEEDGGVEAPKRPNRPNIPKIPAKVVETEPPSDEKEMADRQWKEYTSNSDSIVVDLFHGQFRSETKCPECHGSSVNFEPFSSLSVPVPGEINTSPTFTFIPYDCSEPKLKMKLEMRFGYNLVSVKRALAAEMKRPVDIIFAVYKNGEFDWYQNPPGERPDSEILCFEIPDRSKIYSVASLYVRVKGTLHDKEEKIDDFILIEIPKNFLNQEQIREVCNQRFSYLWSAGNSKSDAQETDFIADKTIELISFIGSLKSLETKDRVVGEMDKVMSRTRKTSYIANRSIRVFVNPDFMKSNFGFRWTRFYRETVEYQLREACEATASTLNNCLKQFCCGGILDNGNKWKCPHCNKHVNAEKRTELWRGPKFLIIQLKRFSQNFQGTKKVCSDVSYPDILDMNRFIVGEGGVKYRLFGVCEHTGTATSGHYTAHVKNPSTQKWYLFNDSAYKTVDTDSVHNENAYLLFYEQIQ